MKPPRPDDTLYPRTVQSPPLVTVPGTLWHAEYHLVLRPDAGRGSCTVQLSDYDTRELAFWRQYELAQSERAFLEVAGRGSSDLEELVRGLWEPFGA